MRKGSKKGNGEQKAKQQIVKVTKKPQTGDAKKLKNINELSEVAALSWTSEEEKHNVDSNVSTDRKVSNMDRLRFEAA